LRASEVAATVSLALYAVVAAVLLKVIRTGVPHTWGELLSVILAVVLAVLLLWIPATILMIASVAISYSRSLYAAAASVAAGALHLIFVAWTYFALADKTLSWVLLAVIGLGTGLSLTYLGLKSMLAYRKRGLVELVVFHKRGGRWGP